MSRLSVHHFVEDPTVPRDYRNRRWCRCGALEDHERHQVPDVPADVTAAEARRLGEQPEEN